MRLLTILTLLTISLTATGQTTPRLSGNLFPPAPQKNKTTLTLYPGRFVDTEARYTDSRGVDVVIQNSLPKGGGYVDPTGASTGYTIRWIRVINETTTPLELLINFPGDPFGMLRSPESCYVLFLPPDTMRLEKESLYDYGATGLKSFLETGVTKPTMLQRTINPKEECLFYIGTLFFCPANGPSRGELVLKEQGLFYRMNDMEIHCGQIVIKN